MNARIVKLVNGKLYKMGKVYDLNLLPTKGDKLVWTDDKYYTVVEIQWDFFNLGKEEVVIEVRLDLTEA